MHYSSLIRKALVICYQAHEGQVDSGGAPYVFHPVHLAEQMESETEICIALLHDVLEDSSYTGDDLREFGFPETIVETVELLTRKPGTPYMEYIESLKGNELACKIKRADLAHNCDLSRLEEITEFDQLRKEKYKKALLLLADEQLV